MASRTHRRHPGPAPRVRSFSHEAPSPSLIGAACRRAAPPARAGREGGGKALPTNRFWIMLQRRTQVKSMREMTVREANQNFSQVIAAAERGETIVITKNGVPVAKITPQAADRTRDPEWRSTFAVLKKSLQSKRTTGYRVGAISEDDKYGGD